MNVNTNTTGKTHIQSALLESILFELTEKPDDANSIISGFQGLYAEVLPDEGPPPSQELEPGIPLAQRLSFKLQDDIFATGNPPTLEGKESSYV